MTDRELMQMALDALFNLRWAASERDKKNRIRQFDEFMDNSDEAIEALRARLAQREPEPLGWVVMHEDMHVSELSIYEVEQMADGKPMPNQYRVYTAPPQREWKNLTHEELREIIGISSADSDWNVLKVINWAKAIEAKLKEKNNG